MSCRQAVVICTRNRTDDLAVTLRSVQPQAIQARAMIVVIDASDPEQAETARDLCATHGAAWHRHPGPPSLARQRNHAVSLLPPTVELVHFLDDDVTLDAGYIDRIAALMFDDPGIAGVGGLVRKPDGAPRAGNQNGASWWSRLFLTDSLRPGRVLASGGTSHGQVRPLTSTTEVQWLGGCSTYRRPIVERIRFDDSLEGYSLDEDLDFSFRAGREGHLLVLPTASLLHRISVENRAREEQLAYDAMIHRYWFVEKNLRNGLAKPAYWWATLGRITASACSRREQARASLRGRLRAVRTIVSRDHYLLKQPR